MPRDVFYAGLTLSEQVRKFVDYHGDPKYRHISHDEARMLDRVAARLDQTLEIARREAAAELRAVADLVSQYYDTIVYDDERSVAVFSIPLRHLDDPRAEIQRTGLVELAEGPTPLQAQAAIAALLTTSSPAELVERFGQLISNSDFLETQLPPAALALINRVLYLPSVVAENSWADVAPLLEHLSRASGKGLPVVLFSGALVGTNSVVVAFLAGGSVIVLQLLQSVADGMTPGLRQWGSRLVKEAPPDDGAATEQDE